VIEKKIQDAYCNKFSNIVFDKLWLPIRNDLQQQQKRTVSFYLSFSKEANCWFCFISGSYICNITLRKKENIRTKQPLPTFFLFLSVLFLLIACSKTAKKGTVYCSL
jgi:hypothetical protein